MGLSIFPTPSTGSTSVVPLIRGWAATGSGTYTLTETLPAGIYHIETKDLPISHTNGAALKKGSTGKLFYKSVYEKALNDVESQVFQEMLDTDDYELAQIDKMKTPMLSVVSNHSPEKKFLNLLSIFLAL